MRRKSTEKDTQRAVLDYLTAKRIFHWRNNTGALLTKAGHFMRFGAVGSPDIFALHKGTLYGFEVKDIRGKLSEEQKSFGVNMECAGGKYIVVRSVDDVISLF